MNKIFILIALVFSFQSQANQPLPESVFLLHTAINGSACRAAEPEIFGPTLILDQDNVVFVIKCRDDIFTDYLNLYIYNKVSGNASAVNLISWDYNGKKLAPTFILQGDLEGYMDTTSGDEMKLRYLFPLTQGSCGFKQKIKFTKGADGKYSGETTEIRARYKCDNDYYAKYPVVFQQ